MSIYSFTLAIFIFLINLFSIYKERLLDWCPPRLNLADQIIIHNSVGLLLFVY